MNKEEKFHNIVYICWLLRNNPLINTISELHKISGLKRQDIYRIKQDLIICANQAEISLPQWFLQ